MKKFPVLLALFMTFVAAACSGSATQDGPELDSPTVQVEDIQQVEAVEPAPTAAAPMATAVTAVLPIIAPAPAWKNEVWINSETSLPLEDLRGKVVLLEFWTFG